MSKKYFLVITISVLMISLFSDVNDLIQEKDQILEALNKTVQFQLYMIPLLSVADTIDVFNIDEIQGFEKIGEDMYKIIIADSLLTKIDKLWQWQERNQRFFSLRIIDNPENTDEKEDSSIKSYFPWLFYYGNTAIAYEPDLKVSPIVATVENDIALAIYAALKALEEKKGHALKGESYSCNGKEYIEKIYIGDIIVRDAGDKYQIYSKSHMNCLGGGFECLIKKGTYDIIKLKKGY